MTSANRSPIMITMVAAIGHVLPLLPLSTNCSRTGVVGQVRNERYVGAHC